VLENINDEAIDVTLEVSRASTFRKALVLPEGPDNTVLSQSGNSVSIRISPRTLVAVEYQ
jgi:hypothetical protein